MVRQIDVTANRPAVTCKNNAQMTTQKIHLQLTGFALWRSRTLALSHWLRFPAEFRVGAGVWGLGLQVRAQDRVLGLELGLGFGAGAGDWGLGLELGLGFEAEARA